MKSFRELILFRVLEHRKEKRERVINVERLFVFSDTAISRRCFEESSEEMFQSDKCTCEACMNCV